MRRTPAHLARYEFPGQEAVRSPEGPRHTTGKSGHRCHLVIEDVRPLFTNDLLAVPGVDLDRRLITHRSRGNKQASLTAEELGGVFLEAVNSWVLAINIIADVCLGHSATHRRRGTGDGVAAQVNW